MPVLNHNKTSQNCRWHGFDTASELEQAAVTRILNAAQQAIDDHGSFHIVLAGGTTPRKIYEALRHAKTAWGAWHIYFGDERCLPSDHADRNSHMASTAWLDHAAIPATQVHPMATEEGVTVAAEKYAQVVNKIKLFDLVLLGLGEDGHTASLFPKHDAGNSSDSPATLIILDAPKPPPQRISLSARRLSATHQLIFLVTGNSKLQAVKDWRSGVAIPASTITPANGVDIFIENALLDPK
jgi:6-phosphogluconolactonase